MAAFDERDRLIAAEPAGILQLDAIDLKAPASASAKQPIISEAGKGQGCEAKYRTAPTGDSRPPRGFRA